MKKFNRFISALISSALLICSAASSMNFTSSASGNGFPAPESAVSWGDKTYDHKYIPDVSDKTMKAIEKARQFYGFVGEYEIKKCEIAEKIANGVLKNYVVNDDGIIEYTVRIGDGMAEVFEYYALPDKTNIDEIIADSLLEDVSDFGPEITIKSADSNCTKVSFEMMDGCTIRYTLNGKEPTEKSPVYKGSTFKVSAASNIKLRVFRDGYRPMSFSYFVDVIGNKKTAADIYTENYFYKQLTADQKEYYKTVFLSNRYGIKVEYPKLNDFDKKRAWSAYEADVYHTWVEKYRVSGDAKKKAAADKVYEIVNKALKCKTEYEMIKKIHDELCRFAAYRHKGGCDGSAETLFEEGTGICSSYAKAFASLCTMSGIDCIYITGDVTGSDNGHAWNMVRLDGKWYYVDTTWDDGHGVGYCYFLKGSVTMSKNHKVDDEFKKDFYPTASKADYKYPETPKFIREKVSVCPDEIHIYEHDNGEGSILDLINPKFRTQYKKDGGSAQICGIGATDVAVCMMMSHKESIYESEFEYFNVKIYYYSGETKSFKAKTSDYRGKYRDLIGW